MEVPDAALSRAEADGEQNSVASEKLACYRCRQRKIKCDRQSPCSHCVKAEAQCSYASGLKARERRQRVMISSTYDHKLDAISRKIDELGLRMNQLTPRPINNSAGSNPLDFAGPPIQAQKNAFSLLGITPSSSSIGCTPNAVALLNDGTDEGFHAEQSSSSKAEYESESSLFFHAAFANRYLQNVVASTGSVKVAQELEAVIEGLKTAIHAGRRQPEQQDHLYPRARVLPAGSTMRDLPLPPLEKVFTCLRMARECAQVANLWLGDFMRPSQFSDYFIKIVSPGPVTEADMVIVHCGLYWLFCECCKAVTNEETKKDYEAQALACEANLEAVLVNFRFHQPTSITLAYAMGMASAYCVQKSNPLAAWSFISVASHVTQALGLQHHTRAGTAGAEEISQKKSLFWTIYIHEKMLSLRLGRSSTLRDEDITLSRPGMDGHSNCFLGELAPGWVSMASIQGRIYDEIYSPGALKQPLHIRTSRALSVAADLKVAMHQVQTIHDRYVADKGQVLGLEFHEIARRSDRVIGLSLLTLIYRSIVPENPSPSAFCRECVDAARDTLQEHDRCVAAIARAQGKTVFLEAYINWTITQSPFIPFIVIFCHIIETSEGSELKSMRGLVETLESTSNSQPHNTCNKQLRLFKALYNVAAKFIEVKVQADKSGTSLSGKTLGAEGNIPCGQEAVYMEADVDEMRVENGLFGPTPSETTTLGDMNMNMDLSGAQLWDWFNENQSIMNVLEDR